MATSSFGDPRPTVKVTAKVPASRKTTIEKDGSPELTLPTVVACP